MNDKKYMLFDYGASHGRCIVAKFDGERFVMEEIHEFENRPVRYSGTLYWDILRLASEVKIGMQKAFKKYPDIVSLGIDTWGCDFGFIDKNGKLLANPANYRDEWRYKYKPILDEKMGEYNIFKLAGANTNNIMSLYHMYALKQEKGSELEYADKFLMIPDLLNYYLTGIPANEYTDATMSLMVDQESKTWQSAIIDELGFDRSIFSELVMPGNTLGNIQKSMCEQFEIPCVPVINVASHDTASAIAGVPLQDKGTKWGFLSLGTWAILGVESDKIYNDERTFDTGFANQGGCEGKNNLVNLMTGLWIIQQCYVCWNKQAGEKIGWPAVVEAASEAKGGKAFINPDAAAFALPSPNMPKIIQEYCSQTNQGIPEGMGEIARCVFESLVLKFKDCYEDICSLTDSKYELLHIFGGGSKNRLLCQWIADALDIYVKAGPAETTSVGNLLMQLKAMGDIDNLEQGRAISGASAKLKEYQPKDKAIWDDYYKKYIDKAKNAL